MKPQVFVLAPFTAESQPARETVQKSAAEAGYEVVTVDSTLSSVPLTNRVLDGIRRADLIVADLSGQNPSVMYELGFAHALRKPTILMINAKTDSTFPPALAGFFYIVYDTDNLDRLERDIRSEIRNRKMERSA